jgi:hypothetical protein
MTATRSQSTTASTSSAARRPRRPGRTPEIAQFQWRSTVSWVNGTHSRSDVETFYGFGDEQQHHTTFSYDVDHPLQFAARTTVSRRWSMSWSPSAAA